MPDPAPDTRRLSPVMMGLLLMAAIFLSYAGIGSYDLWPPDEPRFAEVAREMLLTGDYLVPRVNGEVYNEKPPLLFWAIAAASLPAGEVTETAARLPSVLAGIATVLLTVLVARRLFGRETALLAGLVLLTSVRFWWQARTGQIDMLLTACITLGFYALCRWDEEPRARWLWLLYLALGAGLLAKGPPALVFPLLFILVYYRKDRERRRATHWVAGTALALVIVLLWFIPARLAGADAAPEAVQEGVAGNLFRNTVGRLFLGVSKAQAPWYYATTIPVDLFPWSLFLPWTLWWTWKHRGDGRPMRFLLCWVVPALIFFSLSIGKRAIYILPLFPAFAILAAASIEALRREERLRWLRNTGLVFALLVAGLGGALLALPHTPFVEELGPDADLADVTTFGGLVLSVGILTLVVVAVQRGRTATNMIAVVTALLLGNVVGLVFPVVNGLKSARAVCAPVRELADAGADFRLYSVGFSREEYIFYARHFHEERFTGFVGEMPDTLDELMAAGKLQKHARKVVAEAVAEVPVADIERITPEERAALRQAIEDAIAQDEDLEAVLAFEQELIREIDIFATGFAGPGPAYMFVQEEDWRWLVALMSAPPEVTVLRQQGVGRRNVLLIANAAGVAELGPAPTDTH